MSVDDPHGNLLLGLAIIRDGLAGPNRGDSATLVSDAINEIERLRADRDRYRAAHEAALAQVDEYGAELERLRAAVGLHGARRPGDDRCSRCRACDRVLPCPTLRAAGGE